MAIPFVLPNNGEVQENVYCLESNLLEQLVQELIRLDTLRLQNSSENNNHNSRSPRVMVTTRNNPRRLVTRVRNLRDLGPITGISVFNPIDPYVDIQRLTIPQQYQNNFILQRLNALENGVGRLMLNNCQENLVAHTCDDSFKACSCLKDKSKCSKSAKERKEDCNPFTSYLPSVFTCCLATAVICLIGWWQHRVR